MQDCPTCEGTGKQTITVQHFGGSKGQPDESFDSECFTCKGEGKVTEQRIKQLEAQAKLWCQCGNPSGDTRFYDDGQHPHCSKHCWVCNDCGKIIQVG